MIKGVPTDMVPYVLEDERATDTHDEEGNLEPKTIFWIRPKTGHDANETLAAYAAASKDDRKGYRQLNVQKLNVADVEQFVKVVGKVENYQFSSRFPRLAEQGAMESVEDPEVLKCLARDISPDYLMELFDAANNTQMLLAGSKNASS